MTSNISNLKEEWGYAYIPSYAKYFNNYLFKVVIFCPDDDSTHSRRLRREWIKDLEARNIYPIMRRSHRSALNVYLRDTEEVMLFVHLYKPFVTRIHGPTTDTALSTIEDSIAKIDKFDVRKDAYFGKFEFKVSMCVDASVLESPKEHLDAILGATGDDKFKLSRPLSRIMRYDKSTISPMSWSIKKAMAAIRRGKPLYYPLYLYDYDDVVAIKLFVSSHIKDVTKAVIV